MALVAAPRPYNPAAYVPGGSSQPVSQAIQNLGYATANKTPSVAPTPYGGSTPATTPDTTPQTETPAQYQARVAAILANDPLLGQTNANLSASNVQNQAGLQAAQARALAQFGSVPSGNLPGVSGVDQTTRDLAQQNTAAGLSTTAQLARQYDVAQQQSNASLAARGLLRSGAFGQHSAEDLLNYNVGSYGATQKLLDYLQGLYSGYLQQQQALQAQQIQAAQDAANRAATTAGPPGPYVNPNPPPYNGQAPAAAVPAYTDIGGQAHPAGAVGQTQPGGIVVNQSGGYYDPMTSRYYPAGTGPATVAPLKAYRYANTFA